LGGEKQGVWANHTTPANTKVSKSKEGLGTVGIMQDEVSQKSAWLLVRSAARGEKGGFWMSRHATVHCGVMEKILTRIQDYRVRGGRE